MLFFWSPVASVVQQNAATLYIIRREEKMMIIWVDCSFNLSDVDVQRSADAITSS